MRKRVPECISNDAIFFPAKRLAAVLVTSRLIRPLHLSDPNLANPAHAGLIRGVGTQAQQCVPFPARSHQATATFALTGSGAQVSSCS